jgi:large subunit ribosomal protein L10
MLRAMKEEFVSQLSADVDRSVSILFVDFTGLTVAEADDFRNKLRASNVGYKVVKNTLLTRVLAGKEYSDAAGVLKGTPTGVVLGYEDPVAAAKATFDFIDDCKHMKVKGGVLDGKAISVDEAEALSKMPSREEMIAGVVALALSPARNLLGQVKSPSEKIVGAIEKLVETKE